jgi:hypothetical protein
MITLKEWMEIVDYRVTEGSTYGWQCFGYNAYQLDSWNGDHEGHSFTITFDTRTQVVYQVEAHDFHNQRAYRMINPDFKQAHDAEGSARNSSINQAWDDVVYTDLEVDDDFIQKCLSIKAGEDYDTRISVPVDFTDAELLKYMKMAHERDITFNQLVEEALRDAIEDYQRDPEGMKAKADRWKADYDLA